MGGECWRKKSNRGLEEEKQWGATFTFSLFSSCVFLLSVNWSALYRILILFRSINPFPDSDVLSLIKLW